MEHLALPLLLLLVTATPGVPAHQDASAKAVCQVWQRELSFAQSVQRHDRSAFAAHLVEDAVFDANSAKPTQGRAAVTRAWSGIIEGETVRLSWYPEHVVVAAKVALATSSGPYLLENRAATAKTRYTIGRFATTWLRGNDGIWRVVFDGGEAPRPADEAAVTSFEAGRKLDCPADDA